MLLMLLVVFYKHHMQHAFSNLSEVGVRNDTFVNLFLLVKVSNKCSVVNRRVYPITFHSLTFSLSALCYYIKLK